MKIQPIVEGHGEVSAVPVLLSRLCDEAKAFSVEIGRPIRRNLSDLMKKDGVQKAVMLALKQENCSAILIIFDSEDFCPKELAPEILSWAREAVYGTPCEIVLAYREYETWFLASIESLRGKYGIPRDAVPLPNPESRRGAKEAIEEYMPRGYSYDETVDQPKFSAVFDMKLAYSRSRSFRKFVKSFGILISSVIQDGVIWPPAEWQDDYGTL